MMEYGEINHSLQIGLDAIGDKSMLETAQERIKLLKAGITGNQIEELYILSNNFKVVGNQRPIEKIEINTTINKNIAVYQEATVEIINNDRNGIIVPDSCTIQPNAKKGHTSNNLTMKRRQKNEGIKILLSKILYPYIITNTN
jgi:hypothetical protein